MFSYFYLGLVQITKILGRKQKILGFGLLELNGPRKVGLNTVAQKIRPATAVASDSPVTAALIRARHPHPVEP